MRVISRVYIGRGWDWWSSVEFLGSLLKWVLGRDRWSECLGWERMKIVRDKLFEKKNKKQNIFEKYKYWIQAPRDGGAAKDWTSDTRNVRDGFRCVRVYVYVQCSPRYWGEQRNQLTVWKTKDKRLRCDTGQAKTRKNWEFSFSFGCLDM